MRSPLACLVPAAISLASPAVVEGAQPAAPGVGDPGEDTPPATSGEDSVRSAGFDDGDTVVSASRTGVVGLWHLPTAQIGLPGTVRLGLRGSLFAAEPYIRCDRFESPGRCLDGPRVADRAAVLAASASVHRDVELFGSLWLSETFSRAMEPGTDDLGRVAGALTLGVKWARSIRGWLRVGADLTLRWPGRAGKGGVTLAATSGAAHGLVSLDLGRLLRSVGSPLGWLPLRLHGAFGFRLDRSEALVPAGRALDPIRRFALRTSKWHMVTAQLGVETSPLPGPLSVYVEWFLGVPVYRRAVPCEPIGEQCHLSTDLNRNGLIEAATAEKAPGAAGWPNNLTVGLRAAPDGRRHRLVLDVAFDISFTRRIVFGLPASRQYAVSIGLTYVLGP